MMKFERLRKDNRSVPTIGRDRFHKLCGLLDSWARQTKGRRIECRRHHLRNDVLADFTREELEAVITLAMIGRTKVPEDYADAWEIVRAQLEECDPMNVIFDFTGFEGYAMCGSYFVSPRDAGFSPEPISDEKTDGANVSALLAA